MIQFKPQLEMFVLNLHTLLSTDNSLLRLMKLATFLKQTLHTNTHLLHSNKRLIEIQYCSCISYVTRLWMRWWWDDDDANQCINNASWCLFKSAISTRSIDNVMSRVREVVALRPSANIPHMICTQNATAEHVHIDRCNSIIFSTSPLFSKGDKQICYIIYVIYRAMFNPLESLSTQVTIKYMNMNYILVVLIKCHSLTTV